VLVGQVPVAPVDPHRVADAGPARVAPVRALARLGPLAFGARFEWISDNRWRPRNRTYQRILARAELGLALALHPKLLLTILGGGGGGSWREGDGLVSPSATTHEAVQLLLAPEGAAGSSGWFGLRLEQVQYYHPDEAIELEHASGLWLVTGGYFR